MAESPTEDKPWEASQYEAALAHLARLQEQLDGLRAAIPSIVSPLSRPNGTKAMLYGQTKAAAESSTSELRAFRENWTSDETQGILEKGKESLKADGNLDKAADIRKWGWGEDGDEDEEK